MKATRISLIAALIAGVLLAYSPAASAQDKDKEAKPGTKREARPGRPGGPGGERGPEAMKERMNKMAEELKLSEEQKTKVEAAMKAQLEKRRAIGQDSSLSDEQKREKGRALREDLNKEMKKILSAEQFAKWEKMGPGGGPGGPGGERKGKGKGEKPEKN